MEEKHQKTWAQIAAPLIRLKHVRVVGVKTDGSGVEIRLKDAPKNYYDLIEEIMEDVPYEIVEEK